MLRRCWAPILLISMLAAGCGGSRGDAVETPIAPATPSPTAAAPTTPAARTTTPTASPTPAAPPALLDPRVTHLAIPSLGIDAEVSGSQVIPDSSPSPPGCPPKPPDQETLTVPAHGIVTPEQAFEGLENKAWIFGHSRWRNEPGLLFALQDINVGDELFVSGFDRLSGDEIANQRLVVEGIYLTDKESGTELITADGPAEIPPGLVVILQTSVRESGANKQWLLDAEKVLAKATNLVEGEIDDPCKYLLLFVIAGAG